MNSKLQSINSTCSQYFCGSEQPYYLKRYYEKNDTASFYVHQQMHAYCLYCNHMERKVFHQLLEEKKCGWFNRSACPSQCNSPNAVCVDAFPVKSGYVAACYDEAQDRFVYSFDFVHKFLVPLEFFYMYTIRVSLFGFLMIFGLVFIVFPNCVQAIVNWRKSKSSWAILELIGLRMQSVYYLSGALVTGFVGPLVHIINNYGIYTTVVIFRYAQYLCLCCGSASMMVLW